MSPGSSIRGDSATLEERGFVSLVLLCSTSVDFDTTAWRKESGLLVTEICTPENTAHFCHSTMAMTLHLSPSQILYTLFTLHHLLLRARDRSSDSDTDEVEMLIVSLAS